MACLRQCLEMKATALELGRELEGEVVRCAGELGCCVEEVVCVCVCVCVFVCVCVCDCQVGRACFVGSCSPVIACMPQCAHAAGQPVRVHTRVALA